MDIVSIKITDAGDGSNSFTFTLADGTEKWSNIDLPYDGYALLTFESDGTIREEVVED
jgi:hypothetical protein